MIRETNKNYYQSDIKNAVVTPEVYLPVLDTKGKVLKVKSQDYSKVEANPFETNHKWNRVKNYYSHKAFEYDFSETNRIIDILNSQKKSMIIISHHKSFIENLAPTIYKLENKSLNTVF